MILGFSGRAGAGKDTAAEAILAAASRFGIRCGYYSFSAEVLREAIAEGLLPDKSRSMLGADELSILVKLGQQRRATVLDYWLKKIGARMEAERPDLTLIPNCRYLNEAAWIRARGGKIIRVVHMDGTVERISADRLPNDPSETEHLAIAPDYWLVSNSDPWLLRRQAVTIWEYIRENMAVGTR